MLDNWGCGMDRLHRRWMLQPEGWQMRGYRRGRAQPAFAHLASDEVVALLAALKPWRRWLAALRQVRDGADKVSAYLTIRSVQLSLPFDFRPVRMFACAAVPA
jgi:hypothetical protein